MPSFLGVKGNSGPGSIRGSFSPQVVDALLGPPCLDRAGAELTGSAVLEWGGVSNARAVGTQLGPALVLSGIKLAQGPRLADWHFPQAHASTQAAWHWWRAPAFPLAVAKQAPGLYLLHGPSWSSRLPPLVPSFPGTLQGELSVCVSGSVWGALSYPRSETDTLGPDWHEAGKEQCSVWGNWSCCCPEVCGVSEGRGRWTQGAP